MKKNLLLIAGLILVICVVSLEDLKSDSLKCLKGSKNIVTETRNLSSFQKLNVGGAFHVVLKKGSTNEIKIEGDDNVMSHIQTTVENGQLIIKTDKQLCVSKSIKLEITTPSLNAIKAHGAVEVESDNVFDADKFELSISGAGSVSLNLNTTLLVSKLSGASELKLKGKADTHAVDASGASDIKAYDFVVNKYALKLSGASESDIYASSELNITSSGASEINYKGSPKITKSVSGASEVKKAD